MCLKSSCVALDELTLLQACRWLAAKFRCTCFRELKLREEFHSTEYHRTTSRCSRHMCYQLKDDAPSTKRFGRVVRYYKMDAFFGTSLSSTVRFCEMDSFEVTTTPTDKALGYDTFSTTSSPGTKFVSLEAFRRKVIFSEPPACSDRNEARVLQCWTKGRV